MKKGWPGECQRHAMSAKGVRTGNTSRPKINVWHKGSLSTSYLTLETLVTHGPTFQKDFQDDEWNKGVTEAIGRLLNLGLIKRQKVIAPSGREAYLLIATRDGHNEFQRAEQHWRDTVSPTIVEMTP